MVDCISAAMGSSSRWSFQGFIHKLLRRVDLGYVLLCPVQLRVQIERHQILKALLSQLSTLACHGRRILVGAPHILESPLVLLLHGDICAVMVFVSALGSCGCSRGPLVKPILLAQSFFTVKYDGVAFNAFGEGRQR